MRPRQDEGWSVEECIVAVLLLLFLTHFYIPVVEPVQTSLFAAASEDRTLLGQMVVAVVWLIAAALILRHRAAVFAGMDGIGSTLAFAFLALISTLWSQDPFVTLRKAVFLSLTTAFGVYFAKRFPVERQLRLLCAVSCIVALLSIGFALLLPRYGVDHDVHEGAWVGVFTQKNVCAREMLFLLVCLLPYRPLRAGMRWARGLAILSVLVVIVGTQSKTAYLMTVLMLAFFVSLCAGRRLSHGLALTAMLASGLALSAMVAVALSSVSRLAMLLGRDGTLTGRTAIWSAVLDSIGKRPILGYGFQAFWLGLRGEAANVVVALRWAVPAAHNGFLEIWLQLGSVGLLLFLVGFLQALKRACGLVRYPSLGLAVWPLSVLCLTLVYNFDESSLMQPNDFLWVLYVATLVNLDRTRSARRAAFATLESGSPLHAAAATPTV